MERKKHIIMKKKRGGGRKNKDTLANTEANLKGENKPGSSWEEFIWFIGSKVICPVNLRGTFSMMLFQTLLALIAALGAPFDFPISNNQLVIMKLSKATIQFLPMMIWTGMIMLSFLYMIILLWQTPFGVPVMVIVSFAPVYYLSTLMRQLSHLQVIMHASFKMHGVNFVLAGSLLFVLLFIAFLTFLLFASWIYIGREKGIK